MRWSLASVSSRKASSTASSPIRRVTNGSGSTIPPRERVDDRGELAPRVVHDEVHRQLVEHGHDRHVRVGFGAHPRDHDAAVQGRGAYAHVGHARQAHALEHDVVAPLDRLRRGVDGARRAERLRRRAPNRGRVGDDQLADAGLGDPRDDGEADGAGSDHQHPFAGAWPCPLDGVESHGQRLDEGAQRGVERFGEGDGLPGVDAHELGERPRAPAHPDEVGVRAVRRFSVHARRAAPAPDDRQRGDVPADAPLRCGIGPGRDDLATELVPHHQSGTHRGPQLEIGAADAARGHLEDELARAR